MVARLLGKRLRGNTPVQLALKSKFYGLGMINSQRICAKLGFYPGMRAHELSDKHVLDITKELASYQIESDAETAVLRDIKMKREIKSYQGLRHMAGLPVRGQHTRNNAKTAKRLNKSRFLKSLHV